MEGRGVHLSLQNGKIVVNKRTIEENSNQPQLTNASIETNKLSSINAAIVNCNSINGQNVYAIHNKSFDAFDEFFEKFESEIFTLNIPQKVIDRFMYYLEHMIVHTDELRGKLVDGGGHGSSSRARDYVLCKIRAKSTSAKRRQFLKKSNEYVKPKAIAIGTKWTEKYSAQSDIPNHVLTQTTYHYVSIVETIKNSFVNDNFRKMYLKYNLNRNHVCSNGVYKEFCCGQRFKEVSLFQSPLTLQIQLCVDEFEPCDALKSKAGKHKMAGVYYSLVNVDPSCRSKDGNMHLIALVEVQDLDEKHPEMEQSFDIVTQNIVDEIKLLETNGIFISPNIHIKGTLVNICCDNLGANALLGFTTGFNSTFYCRICKENKSNCQASVSENVNSIRDRTHYEEMLTKIDPNNIDIKLTMGIKKYCLLQETFFFDIFKNASVDILHDSLEGFVPHFLKIFFDHMHAKKILNYAAINSKIRDFSSGILVKRYKANGISIDRKNLGLSGNEMHYLAIHVPLIFIQYKKNMEQMWSALEYLLQILQIIFSRQITENDVERLNNLIKLFLEYHVNVLKNKLTPKLHFLIHYPNIIRNMGPLIHMWTMRMECKHKIFTDVARITNNFKNLPKTMAMLHQERSFFKRNQWENKIEISKKKYDIRSTSNFSAFSTNFIPNFLNNFLAFDFFKYNSIVYRPGLFIMHSKILYEIKHIVENNNDYLFLCLRHDILCFDSSLNSIKIKLAENVNGFELIYFSMLEHQETFQKHTINENSYIIADTLNVYSEF